MTKFPNTSHASQTGNPAVACAPHKMGFDLVRVMMPNQQMKNAVFATEALEQRVPCLPCGSLGRARWFGGFPTKYMMRNVVHAHPAFDHHGFVSGFLTQSMIDSYGLDFPATGPGPIMGEQGQRHAVTAT
jgi:hypothetical protein